MKLVKNPKWQEADQLAIYKRGGVEFGTTDGTIDGLYLLVIWLRSLSKKRRLTVVCHRRCQKHRFHDRKSFFKSCDYLLDVALPNGWTARNSWGNGLLGLHLCLFWRRWQSYLIVILLNRILIPRADCSS